MTRRGFGTTGAILIATLFGAGRSPIVPGTVGTLAALPLAIVAQRLLPAWWFLAAAAGLALVGVWASGITARHLASHDPGPVVIDEAAGIFVTLLFQPPGTRTILFYSLAFILFRAMDIIKPPPARGAERLPGGWGIVMDDLIAGVYANLALRLLGALSFRPA
ncbi:MAG: phosphatidylglycerophosphatase A [Acidobacteria bacterium]|nr:phosphatidylglycerophosphatase A [Acidobacteriota bacterium]